MRVIVSLWILTTITCSCNFISKSQETKTNPDVKIVGAMKQVMWQGRLDGQVNMDTLNKKGLYGLGPERYLTGELLIINGKSYVSHVTTDSSMVVEQRDDVSAPFFVYANVTEWDPIELPKAIKTIQDLEQYIDENTQTVKRPLAFRLEGTVSEATIHIQNLPKGSKVSSPEEAHQGQTNYHLNNETVDIIGFFSTKHQGVFTHHDSYVHMHLITQDRHKMGHLDDVKLKNMTLFLPKL